MRRIARPGDAGAASVIGAIIVLAIIGIAAMYVNGVHVPRQGAALELAAREDAESALVGMAAALAAPPAGGFRWDVPLRTPAAPPSLLSGLILSPARMDGTLAVDGAGASITISHVVPAPASGVGANDDMRVDLANGEMRVFLVGNASAGQPLGGVDARVGGAYLDGATYRMEGGAVIAVREGGASSLVEAPALRVLSDGADTRVRWHVPLLAGAASERSGDSSAVVAFDTGPTAALTARASELRIVVHAEGTLDAWRTAMEDAVGTLGMVAVDENAQTVTVTIPAPAGGAVVEDMRVTMHATTLSGRSAG